MIYLVGIILVFFFSVIQVSLFNLNLVILLSFFLLLRKSERGSLLFVFLTGVVFDLITGSTLGISSLALLVSSAIVLLYNQRFSFSNPLIVFVFFLIFYFLSLRLMGRAWDFSEVFFFSSLVQIARFVHPGLFKNELQKIKL